MMFADSKIRRCHGNFKSFLKIKAEIMVLVFAGCCRVSLNEIDVTESKCPIVHFSDGANPKIPNPEHPELRQTELRPFRILGHEAMPNF